MTRTTAALLVASLLVVLFAWQAQSQPQQGFGPTYDTTNRALRVNVVAGGGAGGTSSNFGTAFPGTGTAVGGKDPNGAMASFTISNTGRLQVTCDNCSSAAATFGQGFPSNGGPGGYKDALGAFASFTGQNGKQNVIVGNESTIAATVTSSSVLGTAIPSTGYLISARDALGSMASLSAANNKLNVVVDSASNLNATVTSSSVLGTAAPSTAYQLGFRDALGALASVTASNGLPVNMIASSVASGGTSSNFGTAFPSSGTAAGFKDQFGAMASATTFNGKQNVVVGNESTLVATVSTSAVLGTAAPSWGFPNAYRDSLGALASWTGANGKGNVIVDSASNMSATVTSGNSVGTAAPSTAYQVAYRDSLGALASVTSTNPMPTRPDYSGATAAAVPARAAYIGGNGSGNVTGYFHCDSQASISTANIGNYRLIASASNATIYVCGYTFVAGTTPNSVKFLQGRDDGSSGSACTGTVSGGAPDLTGAMNAAASGGVVNGTGIMPIFHTSANYGLCINLSAGGQVSGHITYTRF